MSQARLIAKVASLPPPHPGISPGKVHHMGGDPHPPLSLYAGYMKQRQKDQYLWKYGTGPNWNRGNKRYT